MIPKRPRYFNANGGALNWHKIKHQMPFKQRRGTPTQLKRDRATFACQSQLHWYDTAQVNWSRELRGLSETTRKRAKNFEHQAKPYKCRAKIPRIPSNSSCKIATPPPHINRNRINSNSAEDAKAFNPVNAKTTKNHWEVCQVDPMEGKGSNWPQQQYSSPLT